MKCIITVDTEADNQWKQRDITLENLSWLPRFQEVCERRGFAPTYFVSYEVAEDAAASAGLNAWAHTGRAEIGAHLHPWTAPPFEELDETRQRFPTELSKEVFEVKLAHLTERITSRFGTPPQSFRAGRWGFAEWMAPVLRTHGYRVDSSVTPLVSWEEKGGPDFRDAGILPYTINEGVLEVPMTILPTGTGVWAARKVAAMQNGIVKRALNKLVVRPRWCRIFPRTTKVRDLIALHQAALRDELPALVFMVHSSELMPGGSPYIKSEEELEEFYAVFEQFLTYLDLQGVRGTTLASFARSYAETRPR